MVQRAYTYLDIARVQLEKSVVLYMSEGDYISAITLAGAAEEILGKMVKFSGKKNALAQEVEVGLELNEIFSGCPDLRELSANEIIAEAVFWRNRMKHLDVSTLTGVLLDDKEAAKDLIERALKNYEALGQQLSAEMIKCRNTILDAV